VRHDLCLLECSSVGVLVGGLGTLTLFGMCEELQK
jgi:hypothetical protein